MKRALLRWLSGKGRGVRTGRRSKGVRLEVEAFESRLVPTVVAPVEYPKVIATFAQEGPAEPPNGFFDVFDPEVVTGGRCAEADPRAEADQPQPWDGWPQSDGTIPCCTEDTSNIPCAKPPSWSNWTPPQTTNSATTDTADSAAPADAISAFDDAAASAAAEQVVAAGVDVTGPEQFAFLNEVFSQPFISSIQHSGSTFSDPLPLEPLTFDFSTVPFQDRFDAGTSTPAGSEESFFDGFYYADATISVQLPRSMVGNPGP